MGSNTELMESRLVTARNEILQELQVNRRIDPRRKQYLLARLRTLERDIGAMGFSETDIEKNDISYGGAANTVSVAAKQYFIPVK
jgi:hypothetical protein